MNSFTLEIWDDEGKRCTFYTITKDGATKSEIEKFIAKYETDPVHGESLTILINLILKTIGEDHGATHLLFNRFENQVIGLPMHGKKYLKGELFYFPQFPLRLYALKLRESIVILFNGGEKDGEQNQTSSVHMNWTEACHYASRINEAIVDGRIFVDEAQRKLLDEEGNESIYIY